MKLGFLNLHTQKKKVENKQPTAALSPMDTNLTEDQIPPLKETKGTGEWVKVINLSLTHTHLLQSQKGYKEKALLCRVHTAVRDWVSELWINTAPNITYEWLQWISIVIFIPTVVTLLFSYSHFINCFNVSELLSLIYIEYAKITALQ